MPFLAFSIFYIKLSPHQTVLFGRIDFCKTSLLFFLHSLSFWMLPPQSPYHQSDALLHPAIQDLAGSQQPQKCKILLNPLSATGDPVPVQPRKCKILLNPLSAIGDPVPVQPQKCKFLLNLLSATGDPELCPYNGVN